MILNYIYAGICKASDIESLVSCSQPYKYYMYPSLNVLVKSDVFYGSTDFKTELKNTNKHLYLHISS